MTVKDTNDLQENFRTLGRKEKTKVNESET